MYRRRLLSATCCIALAAGCTDRLSGDGEDAGAPPTVGEPSDDVSLHPVRLWNEADEARAFDLELERGGESVFEEGYEIGPGEYVRVDLAERGEYAAFVSVDGETVIDDRPIDDRWFDNECAETDLYVEADGMTSTETSPDTECEGGA